MALRSGKYDPIYKWLQSQSASEIDVKFEDIGGMVGGLPASAEKYDAWWANEAGDSRHVQCQAWLEAGYSAEVDRATRKVRFRKLR